MPRKRGLKTKRIEAAFRGFCFCCTSINVRFTSESGHCPIQITSTRLIPFRFDIVIRPPHPRINPGSERRPTLPLAVIRQQPISLTTPQQITFHSPAFDPPPHHQPPHLVSQRIELAIPRPLRTIPQLKASIGQRPLGVIPLIRTHCPQGWRENGCINLQRRNACSELSRRPRESYTHSSPSPEPRRKVSNRSLAQHPTAMLRPPNNEPPSPHVVAARCGHDPAVMLRAYAKRDQEGRRIRRRCYRSAGAQGDRTRLPRPPPPRSAWHPRDAIARPGRVQVGSTGCQTFTFVLLGRLLSN